MTKELTPSPKQDIYKLLIASGARFAVVPILAAATFYPVLFTASLFHMDCLQTSFAAFIVALMLPLALSMYWWPRPDRGNKLLASLDSKVKAETTSKIFACGR